MTGPISMRELLECGVHFGHQTRKWNPKMKPYIFGARNGVHIIDLQQTVRMFRKASDFILDRVAEGDSLLFVGTKRQSADIIKEEAERAGMFYVNHRWLGGTMTNFNTIKISIENLNELEKQHKDGSYPVRTKKEAMMKDKLRQKLLRNLSGIRKMGRLPGVVFIIDPLKETIAVNEANKLGIPVVAICDSNCNPDGIDFIIPGNDDAIRAINLFAAKIADACIEGIALRKARVADRPEAPIEGKRDIDGKKVDVKKVTKKKKEKENGEGEEAAAVPEAESEEKAGGGEAESVPEVKAEEKPEEVTAEAKPEEVKAETKPEEATAETKQEEKVGDEEAEEKPASE